MANIHKAQAENREQPGKNKKCEYGIESVLHLWVRTLGKSVVNRVSQVEVLLEESLFVVAAKKL